MKNLNSYKKIAKEFIKEAAWDRKFGEPLPTLEDVMNEDPRGVDNIDRSKGAEKKDQDADRVGRDDGDTWMAPSGDYGGKHNGEIQYFGDEEKAKVYAKSGSKDSKGGEEKPEEPKGNIGKGDFDRDSDDKGDEPKGDEEPNKDTSSMSLEKDSTSWEYAEEDSESARYSGTLDSYPGLEGRVEDVVTRISSGQSSDEEIEKAEAMADNFEKAGDLNPEGGDDFEDFGIELRAGLDKHHSMKNSKKESIKVINGKKYRAIKESKEPTKQKIHSFKKMYKRIGGK